MNIKEFFNEWKRLTVALKEGEKGRLIDALAKYSILGETEVLVGKEATIFPIFMNFLNEKQKDKEV